MHGWKMALFCLVSRLGREIMHIAHSRRVEELIEELVEASVVLFQIFIAPNEHLWILAREMGLKSFHSLIQGKYCRRQV